MFKSDNIVARLFERQIRIPSPGTSIHRARQFYENLVPSYTIYNVQCQAQSFCKFTEDGNYLISFTKNHREVIVYRPTWLSFSCNGQDCDAHDLPPKAKRFDSFFTQLYSTPLTSSNDPICKDFFIYMEKNQFGLFATSTTQVLDTSATRGVVQGVPLMERITFYLLRLEDGFILDKKVFHKDFINLSHNMGVYLYEDMLSIVSLRYQTIHILQIKDAGNLVDVKAIGEFCGEDDALFLNSSAQSLAINEMSKQNRTFVNSTMDGVNNILAVPVNSFLSGFKQRLLSFIFRGIWNEEVDDTLRTEQLKKKFYFHFQDYSNLIMWRVQFLDRRHLLVKFGSLDGGVSRTVDNHPVFFAVYNVEAAEFVALYQNSAEELYFLFQYFADYFHTQSTNSLNMKFISSHSNNVHALELLTCMKNKSGSFSQFVKKTLMSLPFMCQSQSPSPYFDQTFFRYDERMISPLDRHRPSSDHPIKFISRRQPKAPKFKIKSGPEAGNSDAQAMKISSFLFHPVLPLVISIQQTIYFQSPVINIHFRR